MEFTYRCPAHDHLLIENYQADSYTCPATQRGVGGDILRHIFGAPEFRVPPVRPVAKSWVNGWNETFPIKKEN